MRATREQVLSLNLLIGYNILRCFSVKMVMAGGCALPWVSPYVVELRVVPCTTLGVLAKISPSSDFFGSVVDSSVFSKAGPDNLEALGV